MNNKIYTPQKVYENVIDYLTHPYANQISGFSELTGYWKTKQEVLNEISTSNIEILYNILIERFSTVEDVHKEMVNGLNNELKRFAISKPGRKSDWEKKLRNARASATSLSKKFFEDLWRYKLLAGLCLEKECADADIEKMVSNIRDHEMNNGIYTEESTRLSNYDFRLGLFYSFVEGTKYEKIVQKYRKEVSMIILKFHNIDITDKTISNRIEKLSFYYENMLQFKKEFDEILKLYKDVENRYDTAKNFYRKETQSEINGLSLHEIIKRKKIINENIN